MNQTRQMIDISTGTIFRVFAVLLGFLLFYVLRQTIAVILFAVVVASSMEPAIRWLQKRKVPRILGTILIFLSVIGVLSLAVYLIIPLISQDFQGFTLSYPVFERQVLREIENIGNVPFADFLSANLRDALSQPARYISGFTGGVLSFTSNFFGGVFSGVIIIVVSFYLTARERGIEDFIRIIIPLEHEEYAVDLWSRSQRKMGQWLRAQILLGLLIGAFIFLGLTLLHVKYALVFAFIAAILELVPIVGPVLAAIPAVMVAFLQSPFLALMVVILFVIVQQLESHVIVPLVMRTAIGIPPIVVVISLLVGAELAGIVGLLLAVPMASVVVELLNDMDHKKRRRG
ncbi:MAG: AI-2E family transporter [Candidatus Sungbacteria bacterium]|uniref:AI-2E family transporter n=1 Tax=Candidatus Sungiibacteriota bacterium TaxID=2750080 RepID=A0A9D6LU60_9BACT|nr:AI-2E family transporter [Candidatus Sungbacteria bacterium]